MGILTEIKAKRLNIKGAIRTALESIATAVESIATVVNNGYTDEVGEIKVTEVSISAANVIATTAGALGHADGVVLVPDVGAGYFVELISATLKTTFGVAAYTDGGNLTINVNGAAAVTGLVSAANSFGNAASKNIVFKPLAVAGLVTAVDKGFNLESSAAFTDPGTAVGTAKVKIIYRIHKV